MLARPFRRCRNILACRSVTAYELNGSRTFFLFVHRFFRVRTYLEILFSHFKHSSRRRAKPPIWGLPNKLYNPGRGLKDHITTPPCNGSLYMTTQVPLGLSGRQVSNRAGVWRPTGSNIITVLTPIPCPCRVYSRAGGSVRHVQHERPQRNGILLGKFTAPSLTFANAGKIYDFFFFSIVFYTSDCDNTCDAYSKNNAEKTSRTRSANRNRLYVISANEAGREGPVQESNTMNKPTGRCRPDTALVDAFVRNSKFVGFRRDPREK